MAKLVVTRSSEWTNRGRQIGVYIDGEKVDTISNSAVKEFELPEGMHVLRTKIDWCGSKDFSFFLAGGETKSVTVASFGNKNYLYIAARVLLFVGIFFYYYSKSPFALLCAVPSVFFSIYYLTIGRNDYLTIKEWNPS